jgi:hypothetical protein
MSDTRTGHIEQSEPCDAGRSPVPAARPTAAAAPPKEIGGVTGPEPTRFGDWEHKGRCIDF